MVQGGEQAAEEDPKVLHMEQCKHSLQLFAPLCCCRCCGKRELEAPAFAANDTVCHLLKFCNACHQLASGLVCLSIMMLSKS
jgi:hypothetical protein